MTDRGSSSAAKGHPSGSHRGWKFPAVHNTELLQSPIAKPPTQSSPLNEMQTETFLQLFFPYLFATACNQQQICPFLAQQLGVPTPTTAPLGHLLQLQGVCNSEMHLKAADTPSQKVPHWKTCSSASCSRQAASTPTSCCFREGESYCGCVQSDPSSHTDSPHWAH